MMRVYPWIDRYVAEVGRMLPEGKRVDVEREIRSLLQDAVEGQAAGMEPSDNQTLAILRQFGSPREIAMRYGASQYVIGPLLYPTFITVLRVVVGIVLAVNLFTVVLAVAQSATAPNLLGIAAGVVNSVLQAAIWVTVVFALLERLNLRELNQLNQTWDPRALPAVGDVDRVSVVETIFTVIFNSIFMVLVAFNLDSQGRFGVPGSDWASPAIFSAAFMAYLPWLIALLAADMVLAVAALIRGRWTAVLRMLAIGSNLISVALCWLMLAGPSLAAWPELNLIFDIIVAVVLVVNVVEAAQHVWRLWRNRS
ncbi:MAG: hypothetical protein ABTQ73_03050 [Caldilineales bacterium]